MLPATRYGRPFSQDASVFCARRSNCCTRTRFLSTTRKIWVQRTAMLTSCHRCWSTISRQKNLCSWLSTSALAATINRKESLTDLYHGGNCNDPSASKETTTRRAHGLEHCSGLNETVGQSCLRLVVVFTNAIHPIMMLKIKSLIRCIPFSLVHTRAQQLSATGQQTNGAEWAFSRTVAGQSMSGIDVIGGLSDISTIPYNAQYLVLAKTASIVVVPSGSR